MVRLKEAKEKPRAKMEQTWSIIFAQCEGPEDLLDENWTSILGKMISNLLEGSQISWSCKKNKTLGKQEIQINTYKNMRRKQIGPS